MLSVRVYGDDSGEAVRECPCEACPERAPLPPVFRVAEKIDRQPPEVIRRSVHRAVIHDEERQAGLQGLADHAGDGSGGVVRRDYDAGSHCSSNCLSVPKLKRCKRCLSRRSGFVRGP